jgi:ureidoglycolate lyase
VEAVMTRIITVQPLTREAFAPFGQVLDAEGWENRYLINNGKCERCHDIATAEATGTDARTILSIFKGTPYSFPLKLTMVERHPFGSQAFMPLSPRPFVVIVAPDTPDGPGEPQAFITRPGQGVNYPANLWHGVLTPIREQQDFLVVDRAGFEKNLEEFYFVEPFEVHLVAPREPDFSDGHSSGAKPRRRVFSPRPLKNG